jgi:hypothetical protein
MTIIWHKSAENSGVLNGKQISTNFKETSNDYCESNCDKEVQCAETF